MSEPVPEEIVQFQPVPEEIVQFQPVPEEIVQFQPVPEEIVQSEPVPEEIVQFQPVPEQIIAPVPDVITFGDIQNEQSVLLQKETDLKDFLTQNVLNVSLASIRPRLIQWATLNYPYGYTIINVPVSVPDICSDGIYRSLGSYVEFCLGMTIDNMISALSQRITGVVLSVRLNPYSFEVIVIKA